MRYRRAIKQLIYGSLYCVVAGAIAFAVYSTSLKPAPTCTDQKQNQGEEGIDCGGPCAKDCAINSLSDITVLPAAVVPSADGESASIVFEIENPNPHFGAESVDYAAILKDGGGALIETLRGTTNIYPAQRKAVAVFNVGYAQADIDAVELELKNPDWKPIEEYAQPEVQVRNKNVYIENEDSLQPRVIIEATLRNDNAYRLVTADIIAVYKDENGILLAASKTRVQDIDAFTEEDFRLITPLNPVVLQNIDLDPVIDFEFTR